MNLRHDMVTVFVVRAAEQGSHEFLQLRRAAGDYMGGTWQIIRGQVEPGESWLSAALRELREEAGVQPRELYRAGVVETFYIDKDDTLWHSVAFCALIAREDQIRLDHEHDAHRWIARSDIEAHTMWASERVVLRQVIRDILDDGIAKPHLRIAHDAIAAASRSIG